MCLLLVYGLTFGATASAFVAIQRSYHDKIGIPTAEKIRALESPSRRIISGTKASVNAFPYFAGILISLVNVTGKSVCGSSVLSANRLVTAAHCWNDGSQQAWQFLVVFGTTSLYSGGIRVPTTQVILHPQWDVTSLNNDIAVIYLSKEVPLSASINTISLPKSSEQSNRFIGYNATAIGFGKTSSGHHYSSTELSHVCLQVLTVPQCLNYFDQRYVTSDTVCANGDVTGGSICGGDSGGPLVVQLDGRDVLIGIGSFVAYGGCEIGYPSVFTRVTSFSDFINVHFEYKSERRVNYHTFN